MLPAMGLVEDGTKWPIAFAVGDLGGGFRGSEPSLNSGNNYNADWLEKLSLAN